MTQTPSAYYPTLPAQVHVDPNSNVVQTQATQNSQHSHQRAYILVIDEGESVNDADGPSEKFQDPSVRSLFIRRVLGTVAFQLAICTGFMAFSLWNANLKEYFISRSGQSIGLLCLLMWSIISIAVGCCGVGRGKPNFTNISLLFFSTILLTVYAASFVISYDMPSIMLAGATTVGVVTTLMLITMFTNIDITGSIMYIFGAALALVLFSLIAVLVFAVGGMPWKDQYLLQLILSGLFAIFFAVLILLQLKLIVGGGKYQYTEDDWLFASISLFYDVLMFFMQMLGMSRFSN